MTYKLLKANRCVALYVSHLPHLNDYKVTTNDYKRLFLQVARIL